MPTGNMGSASLLAEPRDAELQQPFMFWTGTGEPPHGPERHCVQLPLEVGKASHGICVLFK